MQLTLEKNYIAGKPVRVDDLGGQLFGGEAQAHKFVITQYAAQGSAETIAITGEIAATMMVSSGATVPLTGSLEDGKAVVVLDEDCYKVPGRFVLTIFVTNGDVTLCIYCGVGNVLRTSTDTVAYPTESLPNLAQLVTQVQAAVDSFPADLTAIQAAIAANYDDLPYPIAAGTYAWHAGTLYKAKTDIATEEAWTAAHWETVHAANDLATDISSLKSALNNKYDRYKIDTVTGLSLDMFEICPSQYTIVQYDGTDSLQHGAITGYINSKFIPTITDIKFKIKQIGTKIALAVTSEKAVVFALNLTSGNVGLRSGATESPLPGIYRNTNCRNVVSGDIIHAVQNGTKIALYLVDNGIDVPIFMNEFVDILDAYGTSAGITAENVGIGISTSTSQRNDPIIYCVTRDIESGDHFMAYDLVDGRLSALENGAGFNPLKVDLFLFMGQSNMAGRGKGSQAPEVIAEAGYEFRAVSDPTKLYPITEPFGLDENVENKIYDYLGGYKAKSGDMVPAFVNAYFAHTHVSIVGVSASEGGTRIALWQPDTARDTDALARYNAAINWLTSNGYTIRHKYMLWCQGESNGDDGMSKADYKSAFATFANAWFGRGIETIFLVKIGNYNGTSGYDYNTIMTAQNEICQETPNVVMVSTDFAGMKARGLMKDDFHYQQAAYNEVGNYAGINTAIYVNTEKEPTMYDTQDGTLYYTHKN